MMKFERKWKYQSYRPNPGSVAADPNAPTFVRWSPTGTVTIDEGGTTGKLVFTGTPPGTPPIVLDLKFQITDGSPGGLHISATMNLPNGKQFTNELQGWFVPAKLGEAVDEANNPLVVRGSIVQTSEDIVSPPARQPMFTTGFFILEPLP
jgi:hypothetical protein